MVYHRLPNGRENNSSLLLPNGNLQRGHSFSKSFVDRGCLLFLFLTAPVTSRLRLQFILQLRVFEIVCCCQGSWNLTALKSPRCRGGARTCLGLGFSEQAAQQETTVNHRRQDDPRSRHLQIFKNSLERFFSSYRKRGMKGCYVQGRTGSLEETGLNVPVSGIYRPS